MKNERTYPLVSIGIPTYNSNRRIHQALESVWRQQYPNLEIVISDNCSSDNTPDVLQEIMVLHPEVKCYRQESNIGMVANFDFVLRKARGKYFMWIADDDSLEDNVLLRYVDFLEQHSEYALVSGEIKYWLDDKHDISETGFTFEQKSASLRVLGYYSKVVYGGMLHGLIRRSLTQGISLRNVIGNDYHFIANLAYLGEIKHFDFIGYHKKLGGISKDFRQYVSHMGDSEFAANFPHIKMACDAFTEIMYRSKVYSKMTLPSKFTLAATTFSSMIVHYYAAIYPFMVGGKIKRMINRIPIVKFWL